MTLLERLKNEDKIFSYPGTYTIKSARNVTVLSDAVTLKDAIINGNLILGDDVKTIKIANTKVRRNCKIK